MYLRCPWSLALAVGLTVLLGIDFAIKVQTGHLGSTIISTTITTATAVAWLGWLIRNSLVRHEKEESKLDRDLDKLVRQFRSQ